MDKPGGLLVHRSPEARDRVAVLQLLRDQLGRFVYPVHRLDRAASGVLLFALDPEAAAAGQAALASSEADKRYLVLARGSTEPAFESRRALTGPHGRPLPARTEFWRLAEMSRCTLLAARIHTGRRHQIRRHLAHLAHQVIGDSRYGKGRINAYFREVYGLPRLFLHACRVLLHHPFDGSPVAIESPLASDLRDFVTRLPDRPADLDRRLRAPGP